MPNKRSIRERINRWKYRSRLNYILYGILSTSIPVFILSFTPYTMIHALFPLLIVIIIIQLVAYSMIKKTGKIDRYLNDTGTKSDS